MMEGAFLRFILLNIRVIWKPTLENQTLLVLVVAVWWRWSSLWAQTTSRAIVNVEIDKDGEGIPTIPLSRGGTNADKKVYSRHEIFAEDQPMEDIALHPPKRKNEGQAHTSSLFQPWYPSQQQLDGLKASGSAMANAETSKIWRKDAVSEYTPRPDAPGYNPAAAQRVIQMGTGKSHDASQASTSRTPGPLADPVPVLRTTH
jgi:hypothetical protein